MITDALRGPSPNTVCVAFLKSSQPLQWAAASRNDFKFNRAGRNGSADVFVAIVVVGLLGSEAKNGNYPDATIMPNAVPQSSRRLIGPPSSATTTIRHTMFCCVP